MKQPSLRRKLLAYLIFSLGVATILIGMLAVLFIYHEVDEVYDATLVQFSKTLPHAGFPAGLDRQNAFIAHKYERNISYRIFRHGHLVAQSPDAESFKNSEPMPGFSDQIIDGKDWRFFTLIDQNGGYTVEVAEKYSIRHELILQLLGSLILPGIVFSFASLVIVWFGVTRCLEQLTRLSAQVDARQASDLTAIADTAIPVEISPLLNALNSLLKRMEESFAREREFTDNAAHELRTPLAAMKTQAQVLQKTESLSASGTLGLENLLQAIDRSVEMVEGLLAFARLQSDASKKQTVDLALIAKNECASLEKEMLAKNLKLNTDLEADTQVQGNPEPLAILVRNIIQNAVKFTPQNGVITVVVRKEDNKGAARLSVIDTGAGIPDIYKDRVFGRFYRINKSVQAGSGLGLAMVKWIAEAHGAAIQLQDNKPSGLVFNVFF